MENIPKKFSCLPCRQRKIRCDKLQPCTHCVKATRACEYTLPVRGKRRKLKPPKETLQARLARYESLLKSYGAKVDLDTAETLGECETEIDVETRSPDSESSYTFLGSKSDQDQSEMLKSNFKPKVIAKNGSSRYYEK